MKKFAILLSGCGAADGTEVHEAVSMMLAVRNNGGDYRCFAPNKMQKAVVNCYTRERQEGNRNIYEEAGRLNLGMVKELSTFNIDEFDALCVPGGFGVLCNLSDAIVIENGMPVANLNYTVDNDVKNMILSFYNAKKPIMAGCCGPVVVNGSLANQQIKFAQNQLFEELKVPVKEIKPFIVAKGNIPVPVKPGEIVIDEQHKVVSMAYYMHKVRIETIFEESDKGIKAVLSLLGEN